MNASDYITREIDREILTDIMKLAGNTKEEIRKFLEKYDEETDVLMRGE